MKNCFIRKIIGLVIATTTILGISSVGANAEWKQDSKGWWNTEGTSYSVGWKQIDGKYYYFDNNGYMVTNTEINGYKIDNNGVWNQNTTNNSNTTNTVNNDSNNTSNVSNNVNNGITNTNTVNIGTINVGTDTTDATTTANNAELKILYQGKLASAEEDLENAKKKLKNVKAQKTVRTYSNGQYKYEANKTNVNEAQDEVDECQYFVDSYQKLLDSVS